MPKTPIRDRIAFLLPDNHDNEISAKDLRDAFDLVLGSGSSIVPLPSAALALSQLRLVWDPVAGTMAWVEGRDDYHVLNTLSEMNSLDAKHNVEGALVQVLNTIDSAHATKSPGFYTFSFGAWRTVMPSPATTGAMQTLDYNPNRPANSRITWSDARTRLEIVPDEPSLYTMLASHLIQGKLVYCRSNRTLYEYTATPATVTHSSADWKAISSKGGVHYVARLSNLPTPHSTPAPEDGAVYVVRVDFLGADYFRMVTWDASIRGAPEKSYVQPNLFQAGDTLVDGAAYTTLVNAGPVNPLRWYVIEDPNGITPVAGEPYAGIHLPLGTKLIDLGDQLKGRGGWIVAPPDPGYAVGGTPQLPNQQQVDDLTKARTTGGWRFINRESWVNPLDSMPDHPLDNRKGDFQTTIEQGKKAIKVFDGTSWQTLFGEEQIKGWIASLALFRGTVSEDSTVHSGTVTWIDLPDLTTLSAAHDKGQVGRYWIWEGQDPFSAVAGTAKIGPDLQGATLHVGDWLVIADRGNGIAGDPHEVDLHWVRVGGDLLTKSRGTNLFGLKNWVAGSYEQDSLVVANGNIYRARTAISPTDVAPGTTSVVSVPTAAGAIPITLIQGNVINDQGDFERLLLQSPAPAQWSGYAIGTDFNIAGAPNGFFDGESLLAGESMVWTGFPTLTTTDGPNRINIINGWLHDPGTTTTPGGQPETNISTALLQAINRVAVIDKWDKVPISGGVKFIQDETGLPTAGRLGESFLIMVSPTYGRGNPALVTWDIGAGRFVVVGGSGAGDPMNLMRSELLIGVGCPIGTIIMWASTTVPAGWLPLTGQAIDAVRYPELAALFPGGNLPDMAGQFVRVGAVEAGFMKHPHTTARPRHPFVTSTDGQHHHTGGFNQSHNNWSRGGGGGPHLGYVANTGNAGEHHHTISGGGDPETAPDFVYLGMLIKAAENTAHLMRTP